MSAPTEDRVRWVMREQRLSYRAACAWLGRRGAAVRIARRRRQARIEQVAARRMIAEF